MSNLQNFHEVTCNRAYGKAENGNGNGKLKWKLLHGNV